MKIFRYLVVGGIAAVIDIGLFSFFSKGLNLPWFPVAIGTFSLATIVNYYLSISHVFKSGIRFNKQYEIALVFIISGLALICNQIILYLLIEKFLIDMTISKILATGMVFFVNYFGRKHIVFTNTKGLT